MASLGSLRSELNYWNGQVNALSDKKRKLEKRRSDVEGAKSALRATASSNSSDVNKKISSAAGKLEGAIKYSDKDGQIGAILAGKDERDVGSDSNLASCDGELQREINDVNRQIAETDGALADARRRVGDIAAAIAAEERRMREEAAANANAYYW